MVSQKVMVTNPTGLHLGPAGKFCNEAMRFDSRVIFTYGKDANGEANAKSILSILGACIHRGDEITIICEGPDEQEALDALVSLVTNGLGEPV